jgi:hypothetical protein
MTMNPFLSRRIWLTIQTALLGAAAVIPGGQVLADTNCVDPPTGLVAWWQAENSTVDVVSGNAGGIVGNAAYAPGKAGQAFSLDGSGDAILISDPTPFQLQSFSIETWVKRSSTAKASQFGGNGEIMSFGVGGYGLGIADTGQVLLTAEDVDILYSSGFISDTNWHHLAVTKSDSSVVFYVDGVSYPAAPYTTTYTFTTPVAIGARGDNIGTGFFGRIDELAFYNRALSGSEVQAIYSAGLFGKCPTLFPPVLVSQPADQTAVVGDTVVFSFVASGYQPFTYQWRFQGNDLPGQTGASLILTNVQLTNSGSYSCAMTNAAGSAFTSDAVLTVNLPPPCAAVPSGLVAWWQGENSAVDLMSGAVGSIVGNTTYAPGKVGQGFSFDGSGDAITITNTAPFRLQSFSIESWVKRSSTNIASQFGGNGEIMCFGAGGYGLGIADNGQVLLTAVDVDILWSSGWITDMAWHHLAVTKSGSSVVFYIDGVSYPATPYTTTFSFTTPLTIGARGDNQTISFLGQIDEIAFYNRPLSDVEVQTIYDAGISGKCPTGFPPVVGTQPANQTAFVGETVVLNVTATGYQPLSYQWRRAGVDLPGKTAASLTLINAQLTNSGSYNCYVANAAGSNLSSNAVVTINLPPPCSAVPAGVVAWWQGENSAQDAVSGSLGGFVGNTTYAPGKVGQAFAFDGNGDGIVISNTVPFQLQSFTIESWLRRSNTTKASQSGGNGQILCFGAGGYGLGLLDDGHPILTLVGGNILSNNFLITDTSWHHLALTKSGPNVVFYVDGAAYPAPPYTNSFSFTTALAIGARGDNRTISFLGQIDELSFYNRALSNTEVQAIYNASVSGKCPTLFPPVILLQPTNRTALVGDTVTFNISAVSSLALGYQWRREGVDLPGRTAASLTLNNVQVTNAGNYSVVVTNAGGPVTSSNALLTIIYPPAALQVMSVSNVPSGGSAVVPIVLTANGNENSLGFSLNFDPALLAYASATLGSGASGAILFVNAGQSANGKLGILLELPADAAFSAGTREAVRVSFTAGLATNATSTAISFGDVPVSRQLFDPAGNALPETFTNGTVSVLAAEYEGDVSPRPGGNKAVTIPDWSLIGRYVARLDYPTNAGEFQRADTSPRSTRGDGAITVTDWVQAGRYTAGLDPLTISGGPTNESLFSPTPPSGLRRVKVGSATLNSGQTGTLSVNLESLGNESALGFSLSFDPAVLAYVGSSVGSDVGAGALNVNSTQTNSGRIGVALSLGFGTGPVFPVATNEILKVTFRVVGNGSGSSSVSLTDLLVPRQVSDTNALALAANYVNGAVILNSPPSLRIARADTNLMLAWPLWASNFILQQAHEFSPGALIWTNLFVTAGTSNAENVVILPIGGPSAFFRLYKP